EFGENRVPCRTVDISENGVSVETAQAVALPEECILTFGLQNFAEAGDVLRLRVRLIRCDWGQQEKMFAAFAFPDLDAASHQVLVRLIFSDDESWTRHRYPRDQVIHSFWHLASTFWRVTKPRQAHNRQAPRMRGDWQAWYQGVECRCHVLSGTGALIEVPGSGQDLTPQSVFRLKMESGSLPQVLVAECRRDPSSPRRFALRFQRPAFPVYAAFWQTVYASPAGVQVRPERGLFSRWTTSLRHAAE
ncbi:MAG TPA: PilZ domain-containing protein, partial [Terriglobia bacterium]|nr:PilZ domain-containing protein [Terriglobia bacterium]